MAHLGFWWEFVGKVGVPLFTATLVGCLLDGEFEPLHGVLLLAGLAMMGLGHWHEHHGGRWTRE